MYKVVFYEDADGYSELYEEINELTKKSINNKDARIQINQIYYCIELLKNNGTNLPTTITKHLQNELWELRPGCNRILYFFYENNTYILLSMFRKKTEKTPPREIQKAQKRINDYKNRGGESL